MWDGVLDTWKGNSRQRPWVAHADEYLERNAPDLVIEVELTSVDAGKTERSEQIGIRDLWRLHGRKGSREITADFLALQSNGAPRLLGASAHPCDLIDQIEERVRIQEQRHTAGGGDDDRDQTGGRGLPDLYRLPLGPLSLRR